MISLKRKMEFIFRSELINVKQVVTKAIFFLRSAVPSLTIEEQSDLKLVLSELLHNAVVHGNKSDTNKNVRLYVEIEDGMVVGWVADEGSGFNYVELLEHIDDEDLLNECGRGIRLVYSLTDRVDFSISGNAIRFYKRVAVHG